MVKSQRLIGVGIVPTISNSKIKVGDNIVYNYGQIYKVVGVKNTTPKGRVLKVKSPKGVIYETRFLNSGNSTIADISDPKRIKFITR